jgi:hypothetical protein
MESASQQDSGIPRDWLEEFEAAARRPLKTRFRYAFIDLYLVFAPDGIEEFEDAWRRRIDVEGFPVCHIDDIIASKAATNRQKDRESLPRLRSFREYWLQQRRHNPQA